MGDGKDVNFQDLELLSTIGFQGKIRNGLLSHPDRSHIIYGVGQNVIIKNLSDMTQHCLHGHTNSITCIAMSKDGSLLASGQKNFMGFKAELIIWNFQTKQRFGSHSIHKVKVEAVAFSCNSEYVVSLGGEDCRNIVIWDVKTLEPLCGSPSAMFVGGYAKQVSCANLNNSIFVTAGRENLRMWKIDYANRKIHPYNIPMGQVRREILCLELDSNDEFLYCGTTSGDVMKVHLNLHDQFQSSDSAEYKPKLVCCLGKALNKEIVGDSPLYSMGVTAIVALRTGGLLLATGEGVICRAEEKEIFSKHKYQLKVMQQKPSSSKPIRIKPECRLVESHRCQVMGAIAAVAIRGDGHQFYVGTRTSEVFRISLPEFHCEMLFTCHGAPINDVVFPHACSELFATCSLESIRIWNVRTSQELLRITVPNMTCNAIYFSYDGRCIISGWTDGKIRAHTPESGELIYVINDAHQRGVTALGVTSDSLKIVSGGGEGEVRMWDVNPNVQLLNGLMKEHKGAVTCVRIKSDDKECVTSGADGSCIIWDLQKFLRIQVVFANTLFRSVCYGPEECQILTCGTDRKIGYWEVFDGSQIREIDGSMTGALNSLDISEDCETFVSGGCDKILKLWKYQEGFVTHAGLGHSDEISAVRISPGMKNIISVSNDGSIFIWKFPD